MQRMRSTSKKVRLNEKWSLGDPPISQEPLIRIYEIWHENTLKNN